MPNIPPRPGRLLAAFWDFAFFALPFSYPPYVLLGGLFFFLALGPSHIIRWDGRLGRGGSGTIRGLHDWRLGLPCKVPEHEDGRSINDGHYLSRLDVLVPGSSVVSAGTVNATTTHRFGAIQYSYMYLSSSSATPPRPCHHASCSAVALIPFFFFFSTSFPFSGLWPFTFLSLVDSAHSFFLLLLNRQNTKNKNRQTGTPLSKSRYSFPQLTVIRNRQSKTLSLLIQILVSHF